MLERCVPMADADGTLFFDAHLGGSPVTVLGVESRPTPRRGALPADGPDQWTAGTPLAFSSQKTAWGIKAASGNRPLGVLANLSLCDGSPGSLRKVQREYGAESGRAMVNFDGPIALCVVSRYHGGAPDSAIVFSRDVLSPSSGHPRVPALEAQVAQTSAPAPLRVELADLRIALRSEKLGRWSASSSRCTTSSGPSEPDPYNDHCCAGMAFVPHRRRRAW